MCPQTEELMTYEQMTLSSFLSLLTRSFMSYLGIWNYLHPYMQCAQQLLKPNSASNRESQNSLYLIREAATLTKKCDSDVLSSFKRSLREEGREFLKHVNLLVQYRCQHSEICKKQKRMVTIVGSIFAPHR